MCFMINIDKWEIITTLELFIILLCTILFHHKTRSLSIVLQCNCQQHIASDVEAIIVL